ncbi:MAG: hypothetical protein M0031_03595 [Thermaerobacter sp.]|nr:hypothetical protein [Thermaerobacter sp.]
MKLHARVQEETWPTLRRAGRLHRPRGELIDLAVTWWLKSQAAEESEGFALGALNLLGSAVVPTVGVGLLPVLPNYTPWGYSASVGCRTALFAETVRMGTGRRREPPVPASALGLVPPPSWRLPARQGLPPWPHRRRPP